MERNESLERENRSAPAASWVMGRSARWQTAEGRELLAQDPLLDELRDLRFAAVTLSILPVPVLRISIRALWLAGRALMRLIDSCGRPSGG